MSVKVEVYIMRKPLYDKKVLKERSLVTNGFYLPYNPKLNRKGKRAKKEYDSNGKKTLDRIFRLLSRFPQRFF